MADFQEWLPAILFGMLTTIEVAVLSTVLGIVVGLLAAWAQASRIFAVRFLAEGFATVIRATPQLLFILLVYFGSTAFLTWFSRTVGWTTGMVVVPPLPAGVFALGVVFGAYASTIFRGAFDAVPKGAIEAGLACGMTRGQIFRLIKVPQMLRFALPGLGNVWVSILKDTSLISVVGLEELLRISVLATTTTQKPLMFYCAAGALYFVLTLSSDTVLERLEQWARRGERVA